MSHVEVSREGEDGPDPVVRVRVHEDVRSSFFTDLSPGEARRLSHDLLKYAEELDPMDSDLLELRRVLQSQVKAGRWTNSRARRIYGATWKGMRQ